MATTRTNAPDRFRAMPVALASLALAIILLATPPTLAQCVPFDGVSRLWRPTDEFVVDATLADLDRDGHLDLLVATHSNPELWVRPGDGTGRFATNPASITPLSGRAGQIVVDDLDGDGFDDVIALVDEGVRELQWLAGNGTFGFSATTTLIAADAVAAPLLEFALADVDGNGVPDIVALIGTVDLIFDVVDTDVVLALGDGSGGFAAPIVLTDPAFPTAILEFHLADVDLDGDDDLLLFDGPSGIGQPGGSALALADGGGGFSPATPLGVGGSSAAGVADMNGDGILDLVVDGNELSVFLGDGGGGFLLEYNEPGQAGYPSRTLQLLDLDSDGDLDLSINRSGHNVTSWLGDGTGALTLASQSVAGVEVYRSVAGDLNEDGNIDLILPRAVGVTTLFGDGTGQFGRGVVFDPEGYWGRAPLIGDFDGDGFDDVGVVSPNLALFLVGLGDGSGQFSWSSFGVDPVAIDSALGDFNGDGFDDVAIGSISTDIVRLYLGDGVGGFAESGSTAAPQCSGIVTGDFDGDGALDLVAIESQSNRVHFSSGNGTGGFGPTIVHERSQSGGNLVVGDFDEDGALDLLTVGPAWSLALGNGDGTFTNIPVTGVDLGAASEVIVADFDLDGHLDVAASRPQLDEVRLYYGDGTGAFPVSFAMSVPGFPGELGVADFDDDGWPDLVAVNGNNFIELLRGDSSGNVQRFARLVVYHGGFATIGDFDGSGTPDLLGPGAFLPNECVPGLFRRGELNSDDVITIADGVALLDWLFRAPGTIAFAPECDDAADTNDDGMVDLADAVWLLWSLFVPGAPAILPPTTSCGLDPTADSLPPCAAADCP